MAPSPACLAVDVASSFSPACRRPCLAPKSGTGACRNPANAAGLRWTCAAPSRSSFAGVSALRRCGMSILSRGGRGSGGRAGGDAVRAVGGGPPSVSDVLGDRVGTIWLSDVAVQWKRPCFVNRKWAGKDLLYAVFILGLHALALLAPFTFTWKAFGVFLLLYFVTGCLGITLSFHRNLAHRSFKLPKWLEYTFAYCGVLAFQGDPLEWVSSHRYHHQHCDTDKDPHSPLEGFWYSHMGWLLDHKSTNERVGARSNIGDLAKVPFYQFIKRTYPVHPLALAVGLYAMGGLPFFIWGMALRTILVYHATWAVNSAAHVWGSQAWNTGDLSRNNWWVALLTFGEGWHNNHHAFEYSARHGLESWQFDPTWYCVLVLEKMGLATKVKLPSKEHMARLTLTSQVMTS